ncbi:MAG: hypothetical protein EP329_00895 [Deltaproteobacteria bacterium]|nr:MAG: hypothetical protein EP329_00895 [Deltaproteobacteria bacterium]
MKLEILSLPVPSAGEVITGDTLTEAVGAPDIKSFESHVVHGAAGPRLVLVLGLADGRRRPAPPEEIALSGDDRRVFDALRAWRNTFAQTRGLAPYLVLPNRTLAAAAVARPRDVDGVLALPGVGGAKADLYGTELLLQIAGIEAELDRERQQPAPTEAATGSA